MKIVIIAAAVLIGISCADARASDNGAATGTDSVSDGALKKPPLRTIQRDRASCMDSRGAPL